MIHTCRGAYASGDIVNNGVSSENLAEHIWYNLRMRPGRALFVDGLCLNKGYLSIAQIEEQEKQLETLRITEDTTPYR